MLCVVGEKFAAQGHSAPAIAAPSYRLATITENLFPAGPQDLLSAYHHLISQGFIAENITIAGGNMGVFYHVCILILPPPSTSSRSDLHHPAICPLDGHVVVFVPDVDLI